MPDIIARGERAGLGPLRIDLLATYAVWINSLDVRFRLGHEGIATEETARKYIEEQIAKGAQDHPENASFTIYDLENEEPVGVVMLNDINWVYRRAKIGIYLGSRRGRGLGTEATILLLDWAFTALNLENVMLEAYAFNEAALRVYERVGFREIGRRRNSIVSLGRRWDEILMDVTAEDWAPRAGTIGTWTDPALETPTTSSASPPEPPRTS